MVFPQAEYINKYKNDAPNVNKHVSVPPWISNCFCGVSATRVHKYQNDTPKVKRMRAVLPVRIDLETYGFIELIDAARGQNVY